jgi:hypothetical protein
VPVDWTGSVAERPAKIGVVVPSAGWLWLQVAVARIGTIGVVVLLEGSAVEALREGLAVGGWPGLFGVAGLLEVSADGTLLDWFAAEALLEALGATFGAFGYGPRARGVVESPGHRCSRHAANRPWSVPLTSI